MNIKVLLFCNCWSVRRECVVDMVVGELIYINQSVATRLVIDQTECCLLHVRSKAPKIFAKILIAQLLQIYLI